MKKTISRREMLKMMAMGTAGTIVLAACGPAVASSTATPAAPTSPPFTALSLAAPDPKYGGEIKSIEAPDPNTVTFNLLNPDPAFIAKVAFASFEILPKALLDSTGGDSAKIDNNPIGTGPMMLKEWVRGDHITLVSNPNYWDVKPTVATFIIKWSAQSAQRLLELQSGNVDGFELVGVDDIPTVQKDTTLQYNPAPATDTLYFGFNNTVKPWDNEKIRQALAMAIDKERIVKNFFPAGSTVADQFLYPQLKPGYTDGLAWYPFDQNQAKTMLTDAGFDFTQSYKFSYRQASRGYAPNPDQIAQDVQAQLAQIGVQIQLDVQESEHLDR